MPPKYCQARYPSFYKHTLYSDLLQSCAANTIIISIVSKLSTCIIKIYFTKRLPPNKEGFFKRYSLMPYIGDNIVSFSMDYLPCRSISAVSILGVTPYYIILFGYVSNVHRENKQCIWLDRVILMCHHSIYESWQHLLYPFSR